jgi:hypothetical protein
MIKLKSSEKTAKLTRLLDLKQAVGVIGIFCSSWCLIAEYTSARISSELFAIPAA